MLEEIKFRQPGFSDSVYFKQLLAEHAAANGMMAVLEWARSEGDGTLNDPNLCLRAATGGRLDVLRYLRLTCKCPWDWRCVEFSRNMGYWWIADWAIENGCPAQPENGVYVWDSDDESQWFEEYSTWEDLLEGRPHHFGGFQGV